jgi:hypothetical protein
MPCPMPASAVLTCLVATTFAWPALAWEHTAEWRFAGDEIAGFRAVDPQFDEDPMMLEVILSSDMFGTAEVLIEADNGVSAECLDLLGYARGNPQVTIVLTANLNAQTMNGVTLAQCSER